MRSGDQSTKLTQIGGCMTWAGVEMGEEIRNSLRNENSYNNGYGGAFAIIAPETSFKIGGMLVMLTTVPNLTTQRDGGCSKSNRFSGTPNPP